ncbi:phage tail protein [Streptomyces cocklensis]|jgi:phage tail-like protein|uniref:Phage tail protein n=1 Tax=Actinacidiphila cocklensis TaxID=887465 RepID=A0A9W4GPV4_9ACTN|nr:phage tail protein [Actinacidiphila cocklensis]MDD1059617.1 phage tail protein [Actinacidiphila cocklensis]WSX76381.1 phage tail protein [Streptomyces sp. NBC_00899]CAG6392895.1 Phage tail protein [Actinacidiphila cocklensis]
MRSAIPGLPSPHPLIDRLPAVYQEQDFLHRFLAALDEVVAPDLLVLDNLDAHLSTGTAPADFLAWLGQWAAVQQDQERPEALRREVIAAAVGQHRIRGTRRGLVQAVRRATGTEPEIRENGGTAWSPRPGTALPGTPGARVTVRLLVADPAQIDRAALDTLVASEVPAHVTYRIEILPLDSAGGSS